MTELVEKVHGLHHTCMTMHQRFTMLAKASVGRRGKRNPFFARTRSQTMNAAFIEALAHQLQNQIQTPVRGTPGRGRGRWRGGLRRFGSEGSLRSMPGFQRERSNSYGDMNKDQKWRRSNGNISSMNGSVYSAGSVKWRTGGYWLRGDAQRGRGGQRGRGVRGRGRGRGFRGRAHQGRVNRVNDTVGARPRPARGVGRRGMRRNLPAGASGASGAPRGWGRGRGYQMGRGRVRGGISRNQTPKPVPTKEELDAQLEQYMAGTKAALDKELDEYMRNAMDFD